MGTARSSRSTTSGEKDGGCVDVSPGASVFMYTNLYCLFCDRRAIKTTNRPHSKPQQQQYQTTIDHVSHILDPRQSTIFANENKLLLRKLYHTMSKPPSGQLVFVCRIDGLGGDYRKISPEPQPATTTMQACSASFASNDVELLWW